ncbi:hypothetical protein [Segetibacter sp. 3557_3]|nr:hypothetical protein [Segetibacter sp. 3557_3]
MEYRFGNDLGCALGFAMLELKGGLITSGILRPATAGEADTAYK